MKFKLIASVLVLAVALTGVIGATAAMFSDYGTSNDNVFAAGSLDLKVDGSDGNVTLFNLSNITPEGLAVRPAQQQKNSYSITNTGSLNGWLNIKNIKVTQDENGCIGPEQIAGDDVNSPIGELGNYLIVTIFYDLDNSGWVSTGDIKIYEGALGNFSDATILPAAKDLVLTAGASATVVGFISNWSNNGLSDNLAQTDKLELDLLFTLDQRSLDANNVPIDAPNYPRNPIPTQFN